jgi:anti-sigma-K factor RskA
MIGPHVNDQIPAYALGCLDVEEAFQVETHLTVCAACRAELEAYKATAAQLGLAAPQVQPPLRLKASILRKVAEPQTARAAAPRQKIGAPDFWVRLYRSLAASVKNTGPIWVGVSALLLIALIASNLVLYKQVQSLRQNSEFHLVALKGTSNAPNASGIMVISQEGLAGTVIVDGLPPLKMAHQYQLWLMKDGKRTSGGLFYVGQNGYGILAVQSPGSLLNYSSFGITVEPAGGSPGPTGQKVLGGNL